MRRTYAIATLALGFVALGTAGCSRGGETQSDENAAQTAPAPEPVAAETPVAYAGLTGDAAAGEKLFLQCKACHTVEPGQNRVGPSLHGIVGRAAGSVPGYSYSPANKNSGLVWTEEQLFTYLDAPQRIIPGTKMAYGGLKKPQARADLIAYLKTTS